MSGLEPVLGLLVLVYAASNIGLLLSIKFSLGKGSQKLEDHDRRITTLERKVIQ